MKFKMTYKITGKEKFFTDTGAPAWLTGEDAVEGSTMDDGWFWNDIVLSLNVGCKAETDFHIIDRIE